MPSTHEHIAFSILAIASLQFDYNLFGYFVAVSGRAANTSPTGKTFREL